MRRLFLVTAITTSLGLLAAGCTPEASSPQALQGSPALAGAPDRVAGALQVKETAPLQRELTFEITDRGNGDRITSFDESHTQQLHVIAVSDDLRQFVHEHVKSAGRDGRLNADVTFPSAGLYHVYADVMPRGVGQQVLRFEVPVGVDARKSAGRAASLSPTPNEVSTGPYTVRIDPSKLRAGQSSEMSLSILRNGQPATDLNSYLGAAAHVVFVAAEDLSYVHVHPDAHGGTPAGAGHVHAGSGGDKHAAMGHGAHGGAAQPSTATPSQMTLHVQPPRAGRYAMWVEFNGGGEVRRAPFVIDVPR